MPTYDYVCDKCAHAFEHFQGITEPLLERCPACGKRTLRRLIGAGAGVVFKGSGFYETDYKRKAGSADKAAPGAAPVNHFVSSESAPAAAVCHRTSPARVGITSVARVRHTPFEPPGLPYSWNVQKMPVSAGSMFVEL